MRSLLERIQSLAQQEFENIRAWRRHLHQHPELSFEEHETSLFIQSVLEQLNIPFQKDIAGTGIVASIKGKNPDTFTFALRADIDALPIEESNEVSYASKNKGVMHACGHDVHAATVLGACSILNQLKSEFTGTVRVLFQPGEEKAPGGASLMIKAGALDNPKPLGIIGQHVMPQLEAGKVGFRSGVYMASADEIYLTVRGKGGHAATPDVNIDPILISAHILVALQQIVSRNANPKIPSVLSFGKIEAHGATNVIPSEVKIAGTFRTMNEPWRAEAKAKIVKMAQGIAESMGGSCEVMMMDGYPYLENDPNLTDRARRSAQNYLGIENVIALDLAMTSEDFAFYSHTTAACFYRLGVRNEAKGIVSPVHTPTFDIEESSLCTGSGLMAWIALEELAFLNQDNKL